MLTPKERNELARECYKERNNGGFAHNFDKLIKTYQEELYNYIQAYFSLSDGNTKEIVQLATIKIRKIFTEENGKRYNEQNNFDRRAKRLTYNLTMDYFRQKKRSKIISSDLNINNNENGIAYGKLFHSDEKTQEELMIQEENKQMIKEILEELPEAQREIVILRMFGNLSFKEIAKETEVSINTALGRMRYAILNLRKILAKKTCKS